MFTTISQIKEANRKLGHHWFEPATMRFFNSKVESSVFGGCYFITSERPPYGNRKYSIRKANENGSIDTIGEFCGYNSFESAREAIRELCNNG